MSSESSRVAPSRLDEAMDIAVGESPLQPTREHLIALTVEIGKLLDENDKLRKSATDLGVRLLNKLEQAKAKSEPQALMETQVRAQNDRKWLVAFTGVALVAVTVYIVAATSPWWNQ